MANPRFLQQQQKPLPPESMSEVGLNLGPAQLPGFELAITPNAPDPSGVMPTGSTVTLGQLGYLYTADGAVVPVHTVSPSTTPVPAGRP